MTNHRREDVLEDVIFLLEAGESPTDIARRLGLKPNSVAMALYRVERHDLARMFEKARRVLEGKDCIDCGARISCRKATRCRKCGCRERERVKRGEAS